MPECGRGPGPALPAPAEGGHPGGSGGRLGGAYDEQVRVRDWSLALAALALVGALAWLASSRTPGSAARAAAEAGLAPSEAAAGPRAALSEADPRPAQEQPAGEPAPQGSAEAGRSALALPAAELLERWSLRVVAEQGGQPITGALAVLAAGERRAEARSDALGRIELQWPAGERADLSLSHAGFDSLRVADLEGSRERPVELRARGSLAGEVRWKGAGDSSGLLVQAWRTQGEIKLGEPQAFVRSDEQGRFAFPDLETGEYAVGVMADDGERGSTPLALQAGVLVASAQRATVFLELDPGVGLEVEVRRSGSGPVADCLVSVLPQSPGLDFSEELSRRALTDALGRARFRGLPEGQVRLSLRSPAAEKSERIVALGPGLKHESVELPASARISGRVLDTDGKPLPFARIGLASEEQGRLLVRENLERTPGPLEDGRWLSTSADAEGRFRFPEVPAQQALWLTAFPAESSAEEQRFPGTLHVGQIAPAQERSGLEIALWIGRAVSGRVVLEDGRPAAGAEVTPRIQQNGHTRDGAAVLADADGRFAFDRVRERQARLAVALEGYQPRAVEVPEGREPAELTITLQPKGPELCGLVVDRQGAAIADALVELRRERERRRDRSGEFGRFRFEAPPDGPWTLIVSAPGFRSAERAVQLPMGESVLVVLERQPEPPRGRLFGECLLGWSSSPVEGLRLEGIGSAAIELRGGRFFVNGLRPGELVLSASALGTERLVLPPVELPPGGNLDLGTLRLFPLATLALNVQGSFPRRSLRARLEPLEREAGGVGGDRPPIQAQRGNSNIRACQAAWELVVEANGMAPHRERVVLEQAFTALTVQLEPAE